MLIEDFIDQSNKLTLLEDLISLYSETVDDLGFNHFIYSLYTNSPQLRLSKQPGLVNSFPKPWLEHYTKNAYMDCDPLYTRSVGARGVFSWSSIDAMPMSKKERSIMDQRREDAGLKNGFTALIPGPMGELIGMSVATDRPTMDADKNHSSRLYAIMNQFHLRFMDIASTPLTLPHVKLSSREKSVLLWASHGKSNNDIATILGISPKTVEFHFSSIFKKMGVNSRVLAVLKAINLRLIAP